MEDEVFAGIFKGVDESVGAADQDGPSLLVSPPLLQRHHHFAGPRP